MPDWSVRSLRATFFTAGRAKHSAAEWWNVLAGRTEEDLQISSGPGGRASAIGPVYANASDGLQLQVQRLPDRMDVQINVPFTLTDDLTVEFERTVSAAHGIEDLTVRIHRWMSLVPDCTRIALGCLAAIPVPSKGAGYELLVPFLKAVQIDPQGSSDFLYQINRPRKSRAVEIDLEVNRMSKWSVATLHVQGTVGEPSGAVVPRAMQASLQMCSVELDISTDAQNATSLDEGMRHALWDEMSGMALELLSHGDIP